MALKGRFTTSLTAGAAVLACSAQVAQAHAPTVQSTIRAQDKAVLESSTVKKILATGQVTKSELPKVIREFGILQGKLSHAAGVVAAAPASSATARTGRADWVAGKRLAAKAIGTYVVAFTDIEHNHTSAAKTQGRKAVQIILAADKLIIRADKALRLPIGT